MLRLLASVPAAAFALRAQINLTAFQVRVLGLVAEFVIIVAAAVGSGVAYHLMAYHDSGNLHAFLSVGVLMGFIHCSSRIAWGGLKARPAAAVSLPIRDVLPSWNLAFFALLLAGLISKQTEFYSRATLLLTYGLGFGGLVLLRWLSKPLERQFGRTAAERILVVGTTGAIDDFQQRWLGTFTGDAVVKTIVLPQHSDLELDDALQRARGDARQIGATCVLLLIPWSRSDLVERCTEALLSLPLRVQVGLDASLERYHAASVSHDLGAPSLQLTRPPLRKVELVLKRAVDIVVSVTGLVLLAPLFVLIAIAIKLDTPGPVIFRQRRGGFSENTFWICKFRSMTTWEDGDFVKQAQRVDPRVTRVGYWLRRLNLDELPQLLNVLRGEMSIVGPRPYALSHDREFHHIVANYARRRAVKPGITGWAQIYGLRGVTDTSGKIRKRVEYDLYYIDNWSLTLDLYIIVMTVLSPRARRNAC